MTSFHSHTPGDTSGGSPNPSGRVSSGGEAEGGSAHSGLLLSPQKGAGVLQEPWLGGKLC